VDLSLLDDFYSSYLEYKNDKKNKTIAKKFEKVLKNLRTELVSFFE
jgi:hypothetical protein